MTQRKPVQPGCEPPSGGKTSAECSLQVAFGELQNHLRQSRTEIDRLNRQRAKLAAEVEAKAISLGYLQRELEKGEKERRALQQKLLEATEENGELRKRLSRDVETREPGPHSRFDPPPSPSTFKHPVDLGGADSAESWEGVSRSLLSKMWREMDELQELGKKFVPDSPAPDERAGAPSDPIVEDAKVEEVEEDEESLSEVVSVMASQLKAARDKLLEQKRLLMVLAKTAGPALRTRGEAKGPAPAAKGTAKGCTTGEDGRRTPARGGRSKRTCPVCESSFPTEFPQEAFEEHVMRHMAP